MHCDRRGLILRGGLNRVTTFNHEKNAAAAKIYFTGPKLYLARNCHTAA
jgi:hypothetical protein